MEWEPVLPEGLGIDFHPNQRIEEIVLAGHKETRLLEEVGHYRSHGEDCILSQPLLVLVEVGVCA